jgi:mRNA interferase MazF
VGVDDGLKHDSSIHCDELVSLSKAVLTDYVGALRAPKVRELNRALRAALELPDMEIDEARRLRWPMPS